MTKRKIVKRSKKEKHQQKGSFFAAKRIKNEIIQ
jgi:hypothetical protein